MDPRWLRGVSSLDSRKTLIMTHHIKIMLDRVVAEVFNEDFVVANRGSDDAACSTSVQVSKVP